MALCLLAGLLMAMPAMAAEAAPDILEITPDGKGNLNVKWTDTGVGSYAVYWEHRVDEFDAKAQVPAYRDIPVETGATSAAITYVPGLPCYVIVCDSEDNWACKAYTPDEAPAFRDGNWTSGIRRLTLTPRQRSGSRYKNALSFSAETLNAGRENWGLNIIYECPSLASPRTLHEVYTITDPNGYTAIIRDTMQEYGANDYGVHHPCEYDFFELMPYFDYQKAVYSSVPTGEYTFTICWNGMYVADKTFTVE